MTIILMPLVVCIVGLLMYVFMSNPKAQELGRIMFFCGLLVVLWNAPHTGSIVVR